MTVFTREICAYLAICIGLFCRLCKYIKIYLCISDKPKKYIYSYSIENFKEFGKLYISICCTKLQIYSQILNIKIFFFFSLAFGQSSSPLQRLKSLAILLWGHQHYPVWPGVMLTLVTGGNAPYDLRYKWTFWHPSIRRGLNPDPEG